MDEKLIQPYRNLMKGLLDKQYPEPDNDTLIFNALKGRRYEINRELMVIGRATNGWNVWFNRKKLGAKIEDVIDKTISELNKRLDLTADIQTWKKKGNKSYPIEGSQFWRVALRVTETVIGTNKDRTDYIVYSNLYKVARDAKNPSPKLIEVSQLDCINILQTEIEIFQPKRILILTGYDWAEPFLSKMGAIGIANPSAKEVQFIGKLDKSEVVVAVHPQGKGKDETKITDAIRVAFNLPIPIRNI